MAKMVSELPNNKSVRDMHKSLDYACATKAHTRGQLTFTTVEQDRTTPEVIAYWILKNIYTCTAAKLYDALELAISIRDSKIEKKHAD